jgi:alkylation response protein AidB-like acyl-CoA dehydrogenase
MAGDGYDPALWTRMAQELGLLGLAVPDEFGGAGFGFAESCLVLEEAGRAMVCAPLFSTLALAVPALLHAADDEARKRLLPALVEAHTRVSVALPHQTTLGAGGRLTGECRAVLNADGVAVHSLTGLDVTRRSATVTLTDVMARHLGAVPSPLLGRLRDLAVTALAAEQVGGAQRALDEAVEYAKTRVQFGRAIGSFQAVKHRLADMLVAVETARSAAYHAIDAVSGTDDELALAAGLAGAYCSEAFALVAEDTVQVHGGIGFTWEHPAHLWFRRAKADAVLFGTPAAHRARVAELIP